VSVGGGWRTVEWRPKRLRDFGEGGAPYVGKGVVQRVVAGGRCSAQFACKNQRCDGAKVLRSSHRPNSLQERVSTSFMLVYRCNGGAAWLLTLAAPMLEKDELILVCTYGVVVRTL
jgi:hypothetical protein